jgi:hypothetical protein
MRRFFRTFACAVLVTPLAFSLLVLAVSAQTSDSYDLLIIGPERYGDLIAQFSEFKASQGVAARYVTTGSLGRRDSDAELVRSIHDFVAGEYERAGIRYLLLVGTYDQVPTRYVYSPSDELGLADFSYKPTDWYFGVPDWQDSEIGLLGGNVPSIAVGRLPVKNEEELGQVLRKIMSVEASREQGIFLSIGDSTAAMAQTLGIPQVSYSFDVDSPIISIEKALSNDVAYVMSYSHGTASALWTRTRQGTWEQLMTLDDVPKIQTTYMIHYLAACFTGAIDLPNESLARSLLVSPTGPAMVIASTRTEGSGDAISSVFWSELFATGNVGLSFLKAIQSYLTDGSIFSAREASFRQYNYYLNKVIYGDISWTIEEPKATVKSCESPPAPVASYSQGSEVEEVTTAAKEDTRAIQASIISVTPLAIPAIAGIAALRTRRPTGHEQSRSGRSRPSDGVERRR